MDHRKNTALDNNNGNVAGSGKTRSRENERLIMRGMDDDVFYTDAEIDFLKTLGKHSVVGRKTSRQTLLSGYLRGCELRRVWDEMDRSRILAVAICELKNEEVEIIN